MSIKQQSQEKVHHFWARFLLVKDKVKDCRDEDAISAFCKNYADEGILTAINRRRILKFADLATIVQKYNAMGSAWETQAAHWEPSVPAQLPLQAKRAHPRGPARQSRNTKLLRGMAPFLRGGSMDHAKYIQHQIPWQPTALEHVGYSGG